MFIALVALTIALFGVAAARNHRRGASSTASQRPARPATTKKLTAVPVAIVRLPSAICVQWNG
jgi:hypothetical protein